jgi:hypothetical protein
MSIAGSFFMLMLARVVGEKKLHCEKTKKKRQHVGLASFFVSVLSLTEPAASGGQAR